MGTSTNVAGLQRDIEKSIYKALDKMADDIVEEAVNIIEREFYLQYTPKSYQRTEQLLRGCVRSKVKKNGSTFSVVIYMDDSTATQGYKENEILEVWKLAATGIHGTPSIQTEGRYWEELRKYVFDNWRGLLKKNGLNVI